MGLLNAYSTPRLELLGAILRLHLHHEVCKVFGDHVLKKSIFWCDGMNFLYWIKNPSRKFKSFAGNRIGEIYTATEPTRWSFVNGRIYRADIGSRGMDILTLSGCSTQCNRPEFLLESRTDWPDKKSELAEKSNFEIKNTVKTCIVSLTHQIVPHQEW